MSLARRMSDKHETDVAMWLGGRKSKGSGNQHNDQMDGRTNRYQNRFAWAWDCKATRGQSVSVSLKMLDKAIEQAGGERPLIPLRFYANDRLTEHRDVFVVDKDDFLELLQELDHLRMLQADPLRQAIQIREDGMLREERAVREGRA